MSILGNAICNKYNVDIAMCINLNTEIMSVRTTRDDIDLGKLMKEQYSGGGHPKSAGTPITDKAYETIKSILKDDIDIFHKECPK